jgi:hypothetical protein
MMVTLLTPGDLGNEFDLGVEPGKVHLKVDGTTISRDAGTGVLSAVAPAKAIVIADGTEFISIPHNISTQVTGYVAVVDTANAFLANTFTAPRTGYYLVNATMTFQQGTWVVGPLVRLEIHRGATLIRSASAYTPTNTGLTRGGGHIAAVVALAAGQSIHINVFQTSGTAKETADSSRNFLTIHEL